MKRVLPLVLAVALLAGAAGYLAGRRAVPPAPAAASGPASATSARAVSHAPAHGPSTVARPVTPTPSPVEELAARRAAAEPATVEPAPASAAPPATAAQARRVLGARDPVERWLGVADLVRGMTAGNARPVVEAFLSAGREATERGELGLLMDAWGRLDGPSAVAFASQQAGGRGLDQALAGWATEYPEAARLFVAGQGTDAENPLMAAVIEGASRTHLPEAVQMLYALPYGAVRGRALDPVMEAYAAQGLSALVSWAEGISDERLRSGAAARVAPRIAREDAPRAADWALAHVDAARLPQALIPVVMMWSRQEPTAALAWAEKLDPGPTREMALAHSVGEWAQREPEAAEAWLSRTTGGPAMDRARITIGMRYFQTDPVRAMTWVSTVSDEHVRNRMLERIASAWSERDPEAAAKFLNTP